MSSKETVGQRILRLRLQRGYSQRGLANLTWVEGWSREQHTITAAYISRVEHDERLPSVQVIRALARVLGVSARYLETGKRASNGEALEERLEAIERQLRLLNEHLPHNEVLEAQ